MPKPPQAFLRDIPHLRPRRLAPALASLLLAGCSSSSGSGGEGGIELLGAHGSGSAGSEGGEGSDGDGRKPPVSSDRTRSTTWSTAARGS